MSAALNFHCGPPLLHQEIDNLARERFWQRPMHSPDSNGRSDIRQSQARH